MPSTLREFIRASMGPNNKAFLCFILLLLISMGDVHAAVLCFGLDGHAEIEFTQGPPCSLKNPASNSDDLCSSGSTGDDCTPCIDVPIQINGLFYQPASFRIQPEFRQRPVFCPAPQPNHLDSAVVIAHVFSPKWPIQSPSALNLLSTVIILV